MKTKFLIIVAVCAVITLSFTFTANKVEEKATVQQVSNDSEPAGGFVSEDKF